MLWFFFLDNLWFIKILCLLAVIPDLLSSLSAEVLASKQHFDMNNVAMYTMIIAKSRERVSFVGCCFASAYRRLSSCWCRLAALTEENSEMGFVKQVHKPFGVTTERATELLGLSLAQVALPRGMQAPAGSAQPSPSRGHHIRSVRQAVLAGQSVSLLSALPGLEKSLSLLLALVCVLLCERFSVRNSSAAERRWHPAGAGTGFHNRPSAGLSGCVARSIPFPWSSQQISAPEGWAWPENAHNTWEMPRKLKLRELRCWEEQMIDNNLQWLPWPPPCTLLLV